MKNSKVIIAVAINVIFLYFIAWNNGSMPSVLRTRDAIVASFSDTISVAQTKQVPCTVVLNESETNGRMEAQRMQVPTDSVTLPQYPMKPSSTYKVDPLFQTEYDRIENVDPTIRCERYGFTYNSTNTTIAPKRRRIFFGALIADESFEVIRAHATEAYGLYDLISVTESNGTFAATSRNLRFAHGTEGHDLLLSGVFGPLTKVHVHLFLDDAGGALRMDREHIQRDTIIDGWIRGGMTVEDIGLVGDMDETFSRDFLLAAQTCDIPIFEPGNNCKMTKLVADCIHYETSPECMTQSTHWFHPDMMMGECIMGIGDPTGRILPPRDNRDRIHGTRNDIGFGRFTPEDFLPEHKSLGRYPLHTATDFRSVSSGMQPHWVNHPIPGGPGDAYFTGFHFHNFFEDVQVLRHKYKTYGHENPDAEKDADLTKVAPEFDMIIRCVKGIPNEEKIMGENRFTTSFAETNGSKPIFFLNETFVRKRHEDVKAMVAEEERKYGQFYKPNKTT